MLKSYFKIALRNLFRQKSYSFINIAGLAIGMACCLIIFLYVRTSLSYDTHHKRADDIYRVVSEFKNSEREKWITLTPPMLAPTLVKSFPEVDQAARMMILPALLVQNGEKKFFEANFYIADSSILQVLTLPLKLGNAKTALHSPNTVIISEEGAQKYFGPENPMGKTLTIDTGLKVKITGVMATPTIPTHLKANFICSFSLARDFFPERLHKWTWQQFYTYILLKENTSQPDFEAKLANYVNQEVSPQLQESGSGIQYAFHLQPVKAIYLRSTNLEHDQPNQGNIGYVYAFAIIAVFILIIACFNFMNLATARPLKRAKEVGVRKVVGAHKSQLITQYLGE